MMRISTFTGLVIGSRDPIPSSPALLSPQLFKAPDVYVVFGRPKGHRKSWKQWQENDVPLTVVFEVLSPKNTWFEMARKLQFYDDYGVEEYYVYDPESNDLLVYRRGLAALRMIPFKGQYTSPRLGARFDLTGPEIAVRTGLTPGSVRVNLHRGMQQLREKLNQASLGSGLPPNSSSGRNSAAEGKSLLRRRNEP